MVTGLVLPAIGAEPPWLKEVADNRYPAGTAAGEWGRFGGLLHFLIVHFPIGLGFGLIILELYALIRRQDIRHATRFLAGLTTLFSWAAVFTGFMLSASYGQEAKYETLEIHIILSLAFAGLMTIVWFSKWRSVNTESKSWRTFYGLFLLVAIGLITVTGHSGGQLTHAETWLDVMPDKFRRYVPFVKQRAPIQPVAFKATDDSRVPSAPSDPIDAIIPPLPPLPQQQPPIKPRPIIVPDFEDDGEIIHIPGPDGHSPRAVRPKQRSSSTQPARRPFVDSEDGEIVIIPPPRLPIRPAAVPVEEADQILTVGRQQALPKYIHALLDQYCFDCHGTKKRKKFRMDTLPELIDANIVRPYRPDESLIFHHVTLPINHAKRMPPADHAGPLTANQIKTLRSWIASGAPPLNAWLGVRGP